MKKVGDDDLYYTFSHIKSKGTAQWAQKTPPESSRVKIIQEG